MIPIKIQIKNFLSYGDDLQSIDFSPYHLLCLSGKNGHGKSALLDAITWAIWGEARKIGGTAKADHGLLRLGQTHMLVILDFECNGVQYRIRREFALTYGKPYAALDFGIVNPEADTIVPLTEKTIRGTQKKIEHTLHLDYDSFVNSAFLRQGHANEFSKKSPKDRKEILANILGLHRFETLRKYAHEISREKAQRIEQLHGLQEKIASDLATEPTIQTSYDQTEIQLKAVKNKEEELLLESKAIQKMQHELLAEKHTYEQTQKELKQNELRQTMLKNELIHEFSIWRMVHKQQLNMHSYTDLQMQRNQLAQALQAMQKKLQEKLELQEIILKARQDLALHEQNLRTSLVQTMQEKQVALHQSELVAKQYEQQLINNKDLQRIAQNEHDLLNKQLAELARQLAQKPDNLLTSCEQQFEKRRMQYQQWIAQANFTKSELDQAEQKRHLVSDDDAPCCPLCEQNLSATRKKFLKQKLDKSEQAYTHRYKRLSSLIQKLKPMLIEQHEQLSNLRKKNEEHTLQEHTCKELTQKIELLAQQLKLLQAKEAELNNLYQKQNLEISLIKQHLNDEAKATEEKIKQDVQHKELCNKICKAEQDQQASSYNQSEHTRLQAAAEQIEKQLTAAQSAHEEQQRQEERKRAVSNHCDMLRTLKKEALALTKALLALQGITDKEQELRTKEALMEQKRAEHNNCKDALLQDRGRLEQQLEHLKKLHIEHKAQKEKMTQLRQEADNHQDIATALGKNGIQALLIEDAIPEIEQEANELLSRLTENQATIMIESLRDLKSGGSKETLDIKIADAAGIRPYEMFSGGEAFRIDFSLRIAISKLLARRAGTSLQTLIIDEGFGSQDDDGLSHIMDALYKIQDDFKKVIIVSHLPRMKEQFPVHFFVHKTPQGSQVNIIEQA